MKLTVRPESLRVRVDEAELAHLLDGGRLHLTCHHGPRPLLALAVELGAHTALAAAGDGWHLCLERDQVTAYCAGLPRKDALALVLAEGPALEFDVDVRDSARVRGRRAQGGAQGPTPDA